MNNFKKFREGTIRRNHNFYGEAFLGILFLLFGTYTAVTERFTNREGTLICKGNPAIFLGALFASFGLYIIYYLFFKA
jgi:hypothetical protein